MATETRQPTSIIAVPIRTPMFDAQGNLTRPWIIFFETLRLVLQVDGVQNGSQSLLNLIGGSNVTLTDDGAGGVTIDAASEGGYYTITPAAGNAAIDLANGFTQRVALNATAVNMTAPTYTAGTIVAGMRMMLYWDQDATGKRDKPTFTGGANGFASNTALQLQLSGFTLCRTSARFTFDGTIWSMNNQQTEMAVS